MPTDHRTRSAMERTLCEEMTRQGVGHEHRSLHFRVRLEDGREVTYDPDIVARRGAILFVVEPVEGPELAAARRDLLVRFLEQHSPEIVHVVMAPGDLHISIPPEAYDEIYAEPVEVARRIREQDPRGMVRPFTKPRPPTTAGGAA